MKPTRGSPGAWIAGQTRERKGALVSLAVMSLLLVGLIVYQRYGTGEPPAVAQPGAKTSASTSPVPDQGQPAAGGVQAAGTAPAATVSPVSNWVPPLNGQRRVIKPFGDADGAFGDFRFFSGVAYAAAIGEPVLAMADGAVVRVETDPLVGGLVELDHGSGLTTRYWNMARFLVKPGDPVRTGTILGQVGQPGGAYQSLGYHLTVQLLVHGEPTDPQPRFQK